MMVFRQSSGICAVCCALFILLTGLTASCGMQPVGLAPTLTPYPTVDEVQRLDVVCPDFIYPAILSMTSTYQQQNPQVIITVVQRADTLAYPLLLEGDATLAVLTWLPDSHTDALWIQPLAYDGLAIIVHPQNGVPGLLQSQVQKLFQGQVENWADWGGLPGVPQLISRESASGEFLFLQDRVMRNVRMTLNASLAPDSAIMAQLVQAEPLAVGYLSSALLTPEVRAVAIDGVPPGPEAIRTHVYPLTRTILLISVGEPEEPSRSFAQWMLDSGGQAVLHQHGFVSLLD